MSCCVTGWLLVQDVMLSGVVSSQLPMTSSLAGMTTLAGKLSSSLTESVLVGLPSLGVPSTAADMAVRVAETAAANGKRDIITLLWLAVKDPLNGLSLPSNRHHQSDGDCLEGKTENYQVCSVQYCVQQLCTVQCTHI